MRKRVAATLLALGSIGVLPGVAQAETAVDTVVAGAYEQWQDALGARQDCASGASVALEALPGRQGEYRVASQQVVIDPGGDVDALPGVVIHELSHHAFIACGAFADPGLTDAFFAAQDLPRDRDWFDYSSGWEQTPVEQFAEAMTTYIAGSGTGGIAIDQETVDVVARWLAAAPLVHTSSEQHAPVPYAPAEAVGDKHDDENTVSQDSRLITPQPLEHEMTATQFAPAASEPPRRLVEMVRIAQWLRDLFRMATT